METSRRGMNWHETKVREVEADETLEARPAHINNQANEPWLWQFRNSDTKARYVNHNNLEFLQRGASQPPRVATLLDEHSNFPSRVWIGLNDLVHTLGCI